MSTRCVLVIDDDEIVREVVRGCFEDVAGWEVLTASSGQEGLESLLTKRPDAIVLDIIMPKMSGLMFLYNRSKHPAISCIPVVLLTSISALADPSIFFQMSVQGVIVKPFNPFVLVRQVAQFLDWDVENNS